MRTHKDLEVWSKSIDFVKEVYEITRDFPDSEKFGLISQVRRAVVSIPSNIAEGAARSSDKEFIKFLYISLGSLAEVETQLIVAKKLDYLNSFDDKEIKDIRKMIIGLIKYLKGKTNV